MPKKVDITGQRFGRLMVLEPTDQRNGTREIIWKCQCDCGNIAYTTYHSLISGYNQSCGCLNRENSAIKIKQHGYTPEVNKDGADENHILNAKTPKTNTSGYKGVTYLKDKRMWKAAIGYGNKNYALLKSKDINDCIIARQMAEKAVERGDFLSWLADYRESKKN